MLRKTQWSGREPALEEVMAETIVRSLMRRDGVSPGSLRKLLRSAQSRLATTGRPQRRGTGYSIGRGTR